LPSRLEELGGELGIAVAAGQQDEHLAFVLRERLQLRAELLLGMPSSPRRSRSTAAGRTAGTGLGDDAGPIDVLRLMFGSPQTTWSDVRDALETIVPSETQHAQRNEQPRNARLKQGTGRCR
jgi:hypothetical protein